MRSKKVPWKKITYVVFMIIFFLIGVYFLIPGFFRVQRLLKKEDSLKIRLRDREDEKAELDVSLHGLKHGSVMMEKIARDEMGMSKDNEIIFKFDR